MCPLIKHLSYCAAVLILLIASACRVIASYDTTQLTLNAQRQPHMEGSKDTLPGVLGGKVVVYREYSYQNNDITQFAAVNYITITNGSPNLVMNKFDMTYLSTKNPLYPQVAKNPHLLRTITGDDQFPNTSDNYYPYIVGEHLLGSMRYETENTPPITTVPTYRWVDTSFSPQTQIIPLIDKSISYSYKIIKAP